MQSAPRREKRTFSAPTAIPCPPWARGVVLSLVLVACNPRGEPPEAVTLKSPRSGERVTLASGAMLTVQDAPVGSRLEFSVGDGGPSDVRLRLTGTADSATVRLSIPTPAGTGASDMLAVAVFDPSVGDGPMLSVPSLESSVMVGAALTDAAGPMGPAARAQGPLAIVQGPIGPNVPYAFVAVPIPEVSTPQSCGDSYRWDEVSAGSDQSDKLVVLLHGWQWERFCSAEESDLVTKPMRRFDAQDAWRQMTSVVRAAYPGARIIVPRYATEFTPEANAEQLLSRMRSDARVGARTRVVLVGHSMGGLVARAMAKQWPSTATSPTLQAIVTLGTPHLGSPNASEGVGGALFSRSPWLVLTSDGSLSLAPLAFENRHPMDAGVRLHAVAGVVPCAFSEETRLDFSQVLGLRALCRGANRQYWKFDFDGTRIAGTSFAGMSDVVVPSASALATGKSITTRTTLAGSNHHSELRYSGPATSAAVTLLSRYLTPVASITIVGAPAALPVGQSAALSAALRSTSQEELAARALTWTTSNPAVATIDGSGVLRAVAPGSATITASAEGVSSSVTVPVVSSAGSPSCQNAPFPPSSARVISTSGGTFSGNGIGPTVLAWNVGTQAQDLVVSWSMSSIPDGLVVCLRGVEVFTTGGPVSGAGSVTIPYLGSTDQTGTNAAESIYLFTIVTGSSSSTAWSVRVNGTYVAPPYSPAPAMLVQPPTVLTEPPR